MGAVVFQRAIQRRETTVTALANHPDDCASCVMMLLTYKYCMFTVILKMVRTESTTPYGCENYGYCPPGHRTTVNGVTTCAAGHCKCNAGSSGTDCQILSSTCSVSSCASIGQWQCVDGVGATECECATGYKGNHCEIALPSNCESHTCFNGGTCVSTQTDCTCTCPIGYTGTQCQYSFNPSNLNCCPFLLSSCGTAVSAASGALTVCQCPSGRGGSQCAQTVLFNLCPSTSCDPAHGFCQPNTLSAECVCATGWTGSDCSKRTVPALDPCASVSCGAGTCVVSADGDRAECSCPVGFAGASCSPLDACSPKPCGNAGVCSLTTTSPFYSCACLTYYTGQHCEHSNACLLQPCVNGGTCANVLNGLNSTYMCICQPGWTGTNCETEMDECEAGPCENGATCTDLLADYACTCVTGWTGNNCHINIDDCAVVEMVNGTHQMVNPCRVRDPAAVCNDMLNGYTCTCGPDWTDTRCDMNIFVYQLLVTVFDDFDTSQAKEMSEELVSNPNIVKDIVPFLIGTYDEAVRTSMSWRVDELFLWASYEEKLLDVHTDLVPLNDISLGNCFAFNVVNATRKFVSRMSGREGGLQIETRLQWDEYLYWVETAALLVFVHTPESSITAESPRMAARSAADVEMIIEQVSFSRLGGKYGKCVDEKTEVKSYYYDGEYTTDGCLRSCYQDVIMTACGCMDPRYPLPDNSITCHLDKRRCIDGVVESRSDVSKWRECECPQACANQQYSMHSSAATFANRPVQCETGNSSQREKCVAEWRDTVRISVYLPDLTTRVFQERPAMDMNKFISYLGALLGVLMGISIWTFIEFGYIFIIIVMILLGIHYKPDRPKPVVASILESMHKQNIAIFETLY